MCNNYGSKYSIYILIKGMNMWTVFKTNGKIMIIDKYSRKLIAICLSEIML